jgi:hypothetical protein
MEIRCIALWNRDGEVRRIDLGPGINVITGESQTGKSTLIDIVSYCLGRDTPEIPAGPIASTVAYFGLLVRIGNTSAFIGRPALEPGQASTSAAQLEIGADELLAPEDLRPNTNSEAVEDWLSRMIGIEENRFDPPAEASRPPLVASLPHALVHCFQRQDEIASKRLLFHRQGDEYLPQAIKDTLPYFLGVSGPAQLRRAAQLRSMRRELAEVEGELEESRALLERGLNEALALLSQAAEAGLIDFETGAPDELPEALGLLAEVRAAPVPAAPAQAPGEEFGRLQDRRQILNERLRRISEQRSIAAAMAKGGADAAHEGREQFVRLQQIFVMPDADERECCPVCEQRLEDPPPAVAQLRASLETLDSQIASVERDRPGLVSIEDELSGREAGLREELEANRAALEGIAANAEAVETHQHKLDLGAWVRGRIDHFLEQTTDTSDEHIEHLGARERELEGQIDDLEAQLDPARVRDDATSVLIGIGRPMTEIARKLNLEHAETGVRVDLGRLTVVADTPSGSIYMNTDIGSAKNWVGYHLATVLSLQEHFVNCSRPVPRFLVLDQPSQAFFPTDLPDEEIVDQDRADALGQIESIREVVDRLDRRLQVIVIEHADFDVDWYQDAVRMRWREGEALIPRAWIDGVEDRSEEDGGPESVGEGGP